MPSTKTSGKKTATVSVNSECRERNEIRKTVHEGDVLWTRGHIHRSGSQHPPSAICPYRPQQDGRALKVAATSVERDTFFQYQILPLPEFDDGVRSLNPWLKVGMHENRHIAKRTAPLNHASNQVGMGQCQT